MAPVSRRHRRGLTCSDVYAGGPNTDQRRGRVCPNTWEGAFVKGLDAGHMGDQLQAFTTLGLSLQRVKWVRGGHPETEERGRHVTAFR